jgi:hypothetical protein
MQNIGSIRWLAVEEKSDLRTAGAIFLAVGLLGMSMATGVASISVTSLAIRQAVAPGSPASPRALSSAELARWSTGRFLTVAHTGSISSSLQRAAPALPTREAEVAVQSEALDPAVPVTEAVQSRGLLAALLSLEAGGDTTQTSEGLESIASTAALAAALADAGSQQLDAETAGLAPRGDRLLAAPGVEAAAAGVREASLQIPETPARNNLNPAGSSFSS